MRPTRLTAFAIATVLCTPFYLQSGEIKLQPQSKLWLVGDSTLHAYHSTASELEVKMEVEQIEGSHPNVPLIEKIQKGQMKNLTVRVAVNGLKSGKNQLDKNMYKNLKAENFPNIEFKLLNYTVLHSTNGPSQLKATGDLTVAGVTKTIELTPEVFVEDSVRIKGSKELLMTDFKIKPPTIMGAIRTRDRVVINFDLLLSEN